MIHHRIEDEELRALLSVAKVDVHWAVHRQGYLLRRKGHTAVVEYSATLEHWRRVLTMLIQQSEAEPEP